MKKIKSARMILLLILSQELAFGQFQSNSQIADKVVSDYRNFYSCSTISRLVLGLGYSAYYAHTSFDPEIQNLYHDYIRTCTTDEISKVVKQFGNGRITVPVYLAAAGLGWCFPNHPLAGAIGNWGAECSRSLLLGAPAVLMLQWVIGASRPYENNGSHWHPFKDNNGVSGHSFMGAVPFLVAAKITDQRLIKYPLYLGSLFCGLSRINDHQHYFSQVFLGWWIAWLATRSIAQNNFSLGLSANGLQIALHF